MTTPTEKAAIMESISSPYLPSLKQKEPPDSKTVEKQLQQRITDVYH
jgi:hypothetical protein